MDLLHERLHFHLVLVHQHAVRESLLHQLELLVAQSEHRKALAQREAERVEGLLLLGFQLGTRREQGRGSGQEKGQRADEGFPHEASFLESLLCRIYPRCQNPCRLLSSSTRTKRSSGRRAAGGRPSRSAGS